ncbi:hypothetical protein RhiirA4_483259 [Rhizophagus irregularis]|uniref:Uncharacterized protein n=1 Tax=Rhizophagus irregularis TaxID=588596 RepID=A0A2I1HMB1_9GLOM|nr:hypothetical protein RhiirA4_483259 [Rhizophagus irregularis]
MIMLESTHKCHIFIILYPYGFLGDGPSLKFLGDTFGDALGDKIYSYFAFLEPSKGF